MKKTALFFKNSKVIGHLDGTSCITQRHSQAKYRELLKINDLRSFVYILSDHIVIRTETDEIIRDEIRLSNYNLIFCFITEKNTGIKIRIHYSESNNYNNISKICYIEESNSVTEQITVASSGICQYHLRMYARAELVGNGYSARSRNKGMVLYIYPCISFRDSELVQETDLITGYWLKLKHKGLI